MVAAIENFIKQRWAIKIILFVVIQRNNARILGHLIMMVRYHSIIIFIPQKRMFEATYLFLIIPLISVTKHLTF